MNLFAKWQRSHCQNTLDDRKSKRIPEKNIEFCFLTMLKPLTVWIMTNCGTFLKKWEYQTTLSASWETCMPIKKQQFELDMEQETGWKLGKEYVKAVYYNPVYLTSMQCTSCKIPSCMKHKLESRLLGEISTASNIQMKVPCCQKVKRN